MARADSIILVNTGHGKGKSSAAFGGPRSMWGARLARAVHAAVLAGGGSR